MRQKARAHAGSRETKTGGTEEKKEGEKNADGTPISKGDGS